MLPHEVATLPVEVERNMRKAGTVKVASAVTAVAAGAQAPAS
jgi:hypothetical protein